MTTNHEAPARLGFGRLVSFHLIGLPTAYLLTSYFFNFYTRPYQSIFLSLIFQLLCGIIGFLFFADAFERLKNTWRRYWTVALAMCPALVLTISATAIVWNFPSLFDRRLISMDSGMLPLFLALTFISAFGTVILIRRVEQSGLRARLASTPFFKFTQSNLPGLVNAAFFFVTYLVFAETINFPQFRTLDQFFDTDSSEWISRLTEPASQTMPRIRAVHPAVMLLLRPLVWLFSLLQHGNRLHTIFLMTALAGASCVFLVWLFVKKTSNNPSYALIFASLLGASTSHLLSSSILETYIFSALALIAFSLLLQNGKISFKSSIPMGILIFGITITNLAQACILYFLVHPRIKTLLKFILAVGAVTILLNALQVWIYPSAALPTIQPVRGTKI